MSLINEYRATEEAIKELQERLKNLSQDDKLKKELEFEGKLRTLMGEYQKSLRDIIALLDPEAKLGKSPRAVKATVSRCSDLATNSSTASLVNGTVQATPQPANRPRSPTQRARGDGIAPSEVVLSNNTCFSSPSFRRSVREENGGLCIREVTPFT